MHVKLTDKITTYAPQSLRQRFHPRCQWLGTVVVNDGRRGALMLSPEGCYVMVRSYNRTTELVAEQVAQAIAEALSAQPPPQKRPPGRPAPVEPLIPFGSKLPAAMLAHARKVGGGNLSAGIRAIVADHMGRNA